MLKSISFKNGKALLCIAFSFLLSNASLGAAGACVHWTSGEDQALGNGVRIHGVGQWAAIAKLVPGMTATQCRKRWMIISNPNPNRKRLWTEEDEQELVTLHQKLGDQWDAIARRFSGWTGRQCKYRWNRKLNPARMPVDDGSEDGDPATVDAPVSPPPLCRRQRRVVPVVDQAGVAADGNPAAVADAVFPALLPLRLPSSRPAPRPAPRPDAVAGAVGLANPRPAFLAPMVDPAGVSAGGEYGYGDPTTVDAPAHLPLDPVFMFIQAGLSVGGYGYGNLDLALDEVGFAFPIFPIEGEPVGEYGYGDLDLALNNEESDSSISPIEIVPAGGYSYPTFDVSDDEVTREHLRTYGIFEDL